MENNVITNPKKQFSNIGLVLFIGTLLICGVQLLAGKLTENVSAITESGDLTFIVGMLPMYIIAYPIIFAMFKKVPAQITVEKKKMRPRHLLAAFLICYAGTYICNILGNIITTVVGMIKQSPVENVMMNLTGSISPVINFLIVVICAPIMEELLFRKMIVDRTAKYGEGISIVFSGLVFGLFHGNLVQFAYAFFLGAFFGFIYIKTRNILYSIILHMLINFFGSFVSTLIMEASHYMEILEATTTGATETEIMDIMMENMSGLIIFFVYILILLCCVLAGVIIFFVNLKKFRLTAGEIKIEKGQRFKTVILNLGVILYSIFWIVMIILQLLA